MSVKIAKIVKSNSHVDYVGRIVDALDADAPPRASDYGFAQFVHIPLGDETNVIGVIYNSQLANPDYGSYGPRLSPLPDLSVLSPDYLNESGLLIGILLLGWRDDKGFHQGVPRRVVPANEDVYSLPNTDVERFHRASRHGGVQLHYYSQVMAHAGPFAVALLEAVLDQLEPVCTPEERQQLCVLKQTFVWQRTVGGMRL